MLLRDAQIAVLFGLIVHAGIYSRLIIWLCAFSRHSFIKMRKNLLLSVFFINFAFETAVSETAVPKITLKKKLDLAHSLSQISLSSWNLYVP